MARRPILQYLLFCEDFEPKSAHSHEPVNFYRVTCKYLIGPRVTEARFWVVLGFHNWVGRHECRLNTWFKKDPSKIFKTEPMTIEGEDPYLVQVVLFQLNLLVQEEDVFEVQVLLDGKPEKNTHPLSFIHPPQITQIQ